MKQAEYNVIAVLDTMEDKLIRQSLELIAFADSFTSGEMSRTLLVVAGKNVTELCESITENYGMDTCALEHENFFYPNPELLSRSLSELAGEYKPEMIVFTHNVRNCQSAAELSVLLESSCLTAVESFTFSSEGSVFMRSLFNGKLKVNVRPGARLKILTVLPGSYTLIENKIPYNTDTAVIKKTAPSVVTGYKPVSAYSETDSGVKLEDADVIISAGRGIGNEENLELIRQTAAIFSNSAVGGSRPVCDHRWLPLNQQVGVTGKTVSPKLYMACGISGSQQHIAGMKNSQCIVAVNKDPNASIFSIADYIVIEDILSFLPLLVKKYRQRYDE